MRKTIRLLLIVLMICFSGCSSKPIVIHSMNHYVKCERPNKPIYKKLDSNFHVGESVNVNRLLDNIVVMKTYIEGLEIALDCYEMQTR